MSRTSVEIPIDGKSIDEILRIVESEFTQNKYQQKIIKGESVWARGDGVIMKRQCFGIGFTENSLILQGWMQDAITGESDLNGFVAAVPKRKMKSIMTNISKRINAL